MVRKLIEILTLFKTNAKDFARRMTEPISKFKQFDDGFGRLNKSMLKNESLGGRVAITTRQLTHGFRGFRMELLGVMFFGMMVQKTFAGLLKPSLDLVGAMKLLSIVLGIMFLPVGIFVLGLVIRLFKWWNDLSPAVQKAVQIFAVAGFVFGSLIMVIGQLGLGIGSIILLFVLFAGEIATIGIFLANLAVIVAIVAALWITDLGSFRDFVKNTFEVIFVTVKAAFFHIWQVVTGIWGALTAILSGDWETAWEKMGGVMGHFMALVTKVLMGLGAGIINVFIWVVNTVKDLFINVLLGGVTFALQKLFGLLGKLPGKTGAFFKEWEHAAKTAGEGIGEFSDKFDIGFISGSELSAGFKQIDDILGTSADKWVGVTGEWTEATDKQTDSTVALTGGVGRLDKTFDLFGSSTKNITDLTKEFGLETFSTTEITSLFNEGLGDLGKVMDTEMIKSGGIMIGELDLIGDSFVDLTGKVSAFTNALPRGFSFGLKGHEATPFAQQVQESLFARLPSGAGEGLGTPVSGGVNIITNINVGDIDEIVDRVSESVREQLENIT